MPEQAVELRRGDSRLSDELTAPDVLSAGQASWRWMYGIDDNPSSVWHAMMAPNGAAAIEHYCQMEEKDGHYGAQLETRKEGVLSKERRVIPASDSTQDERIAEFITDVLENLAGWDHALYELLDALGKGVSIGELMYGFEGREIRVTEIRFRPQGWFTFGDLSDVWQTGPLRLAGVEDEILPPNKMVVSTFRPHKGNRWGRPLARRCWWPVWFKRQDVKFWLKFVEKGTGTIVTKYPQGSDDAQKAKALEAAEVINSETAVAIPENFVVEILEKARQGGTGIYKSLAEDFSNREISLVILGQLLTSQGSDQGSGSRALGEVHNEVREEKIEVDAKGLMDVVQRQIVRPLVDLNFGPDRDAPKWVIDYEQGDDLSAMATRDKTLFDMGVPIPVKYALDRYQIPEAVDAEEVLTARPVTVAGAGAGDDEEGAQFIETDPPHREPEELARLGVEEAKAGYARMIARLVERAGARFPDGAE